MMQTGGPESVKQIAIRFRTLTAYFQGKYYVYRSRGWPEAALVRLYIHLALEHDHGWVPSHSLLVRRIRPQTTGTDSPASPSEHPLLPHRARARSGEI